MRDGGPGMDAAPGQLTGCGAAEHTGPAFFLQICDHLRSQIEPAASSNGDSSSMPQAAEQHGSLLPLTEVSTGQLRGLLQQAGLPQLESVIHRGLEHAEQKTMFCYEPPKAFAEALSACTSAEQLQELAACGVDEQRFRQRLGSVVWENAAFSDAQVRHTHARLLFCTCTCAVWHSMTNLATVWVQAGAVVEVASSFRELAGKVQRHQVASCCVRWGLVILLPALAP